MSSPPALKRKWWRNKIGWGLTGSGTILAFVGAASLGAGAGVEQQAINAPSQALFNTRHSTAITYEEAAFPLIGIGAAVVISGIIVFGVSK
jgi:hypothetical protein